MQELAIIRRFIARVRRHMLRRRVGEAAVFVGLAAVVWLLGVVLSARWLPVGPWTTAVLWGVLLAGVLALVWRFALRGLYDARSERRVAREIEQAAPTLRNDLVTALQFGEQPDADPHTSAALVRRLLEQTARETERYRHRSHVLYRRRPLAQPARLGVAGFAVLLLVLLAFPTQRARAARLLLGHDPTERWLQSEDAPQERSLLVGNLALELRYPAYTGLPSRRLRNSTGHLEVLKGTEVRYAGQARREAQAASVVLEAAEGAQTELASHLDGDRVTGSFTALETGTWRFRLKAPEGHTLDHDLPRRVDVLLDQSPLVTIDRPTGVVEVTADEVVTFDVQAVDDYGLTEIALVFGFPNVPESVERRVVATVDRQSTWGGEARLDLGPLKLQPKDMLSVRAEAVDNDEVSRRKSALSSEVMLRVASPEDRHEQLLREQQELVDKLVDLLARYLEQPLLRDEPGQREDDGRPDQLAADDLSQLLREEQSISRQRQGVLTEMGDLLAKMETDALLLKRDYELFKSLHDELYRRHRDADQQQEPLLRRARSSDLPAVMLVRYAQAHRLPQVEQTERAIVLLEELIASEWLDAAQMTVNQIRETKERLKAQLERYRETQDPQLKAEIMKEIERLQRQLAEALTRLSQQVDQLPPEHLNAEAMTGESMQELAANAESLRDLLEKGDIDAALEALERIDEGLEAMLAMNDSYTQGGGGNGLSRLDQQASALMDAVNDLSAAESALEQETRQLSEAQRQRQVEAVKEQLEPFMEAQRQRLEAIEEALRATDPLSLNEQDRAALSEAQRARDNAERLLEAGELEGLRSVIERLASEADNAQRRLLASKFELDRRDAARSDYDQAMRQTEEVEDTARAMQRDLEALLQQAQAPPQAGDGERMQQLAEQQGKVDGKGQELAQKLQEAGKEFPMLEENLKPQLEQARGFMQDAQGQLEREQLPEGLEQERQALRMLNAMKRQLQQTMQKERMGGQRDPSHERVEIPEADRQAPRAFREDILDAMKKKGLPAYEDENALYYKALIE